MRKLLRYLRSYGIILRAYGGDPVIIRMLCTHFFYKPLVHLLVIQFSISLGAYFHRLCTFCCNGRKGDVNIGIPFVIHTFLLIFFIKDDECWSFSLLSIIYEMGAQNFPRFVKKIQHLCWHCIFYKMNICFWWFICL